MTKEIDFSTVPTWAQPPLLVGQAPHGPKKLVGPTEFVELLEFASLFLHVATADEIEAERQYMAAYFQRSIMVHEVNLTTMSGARCTRVTWACTD